ncbi:MAG: DEAD/DEAH box helicase [Deltaproteobacteria bacterium]|nr:DEAD/DEAH box helicase [Deltaproteobacteria bacterium]
MDFSSFSLDRRIVAGIRDCGYSSPTPIQIQAIPPVLSGRDVLGLAQTGTGKTAAFALPLLQRLIATESAPRGPVQVLILAPTRELALQIHDSFVALGKQTGMRSAVVFGGVGETPQIKAARQATILVACPGRLLDLANRGLVDLSQVRTLVLDEADHMFDMGFVPDVRRIMAKLPSNRQNLLFSATMPTEIRKMADLVLVDPVVIQVANTAPAETIRHALYPVAPGQKVALLEALLATEEHDCALIFTRTKHRAKSLARKLEQKGWLATSLQGNLSQSRRQEALDGFRTGKYRVMVATDIAARGIDCSRVTHVINFDVPDTAENYTHRIGRTGRADRSGQAMTLVTPEDSGQIRIIERVLRTALERVKLKDFVYQEGLGTQSDAAFEEPRPPRAPRRGPVRSGAPRAARQEPEAGRGQRSRGRSDARPATAGGGVFGVGRSSRM